MNRAFRNSLYGNRAPARDIAARMLRTPDRARFLRDVADGKIVPDENTRCHPQFVALSNQSLVRYYSSFRGRKPWFAIHILAKGRQVIEAMDELESYVYLIEN